MKIADLNLGFKYLNVTTHKSRDELIEINKCTLSVDDQWKVSFFGGLCIPATYVTISDLSGVLKAHGLTENQFTGATAVVIGAGRSAAELVDVKQCLGANIELVEPNIETLKEIDKDIEQRWSNVFSKGEINSHITTSLEMPCDDESVALVVHSHVFDPHGFSIKQRRVAAEEIERILQGGGYEISNRYHLEYDSGFTNVEPLEEYSTQSAPPYIGQGNWIVKQKALS